MPDAITGTSAPLSTVVWCCSYCMQVHMYDYCYTASVYIRAASMTYFSGQAVLPLLQHSKVIVQLLQYTRSPAEELMRSAASAVRQPTCNAIQQHFGPHAVPPGLCISSHVMYPAALRLTCSAAPAAHHLTVALRQLCVSPHVMLSSSTSAHMQCRPGCASAHM
ncbi:hypothetical protein NDU88_000100 [Pleurodeles waltl]|uniref:Uncharacterized protein n=1 Tax=Pleurodeles waltl TaxID=8319 RepID=A0AAV7S643_PLEWA|nr:hypothetical protein NDU88_000100 [Pleurodeles waltl]